MHVSVGLTITHYPLLPEKMQLVRYYGWYSNAIGWGCIKENWELDPFIRKIETTR